MLRALRLKMANQRAETLLRELNIYRLPIDPFAIATQHDIVVEAKPNTESGVSGMLLRHGNTFGILYATHIANEGFQRFSIAHELGHYFLDGHIDHIFSANSIHTSRAGFISDDPYELEADQFAAGLLMPTKLFRQALDRYNPGLEAVESLARLCNTSLTATAIRFAELSEDAIAVVVSTGRKVNFCRFSESMKSIRDIRWLKKGSPIPLETVTATMNSDQTRVACADRDSAEIDLVDWFGCSRSIETTEEVIGLGSYGKTLTVLSCPNFVDETYYDDSEDDEDEHDLIESWTPRFHR